MINAGSFTISLDFELYWGVRDVLALDSYQENIKNVHFVIPKILSLFKEYNIHATWCIVGFLYFKNKAELLKNLPEELPQYENKNYSPYDYIQSDPLEQTYHFAPGSIREILEMQNQEVGTHSFSHYFPLEKGQTLQQFKKDIEAAIATQNKTGRICRSIIFPRNQFNVEHLKIVKSLGVNYYRGNQNYWVYKSMEFKKESTWLRFVRLLDAYINLSGHNTFTIKSSDADLPLNVPASRFLRPFMPKLKMLEGLRYKRIVNSMSYAAQHKQNYHLWWHPHNFGKNIQQNLYFLENILKHFAKLNSQYGFTSKAMCEY